MRVEEQKIAFEDRADVRLCELIKRLRGRYNLNPDTNEDYRIFLIAEGALPADYQPRAEATAM